MKMALKAPNGHYVSLMLYAMGDYGMKWHYVACKPVIDTFCWFQCIENDLKPGQWWLQDEGNQLLTGQDGTCITRSDIMNAASLFRLLPLAYDIDSSIYFRSSDSGHYLTIDATSGILALTQNTSAQSIFTPIWG